MKNISPLIVTTNWSNYIPEKKEEITLFKIRSGLKKGQKLTNQDQTNENSLDYGNF